MWTTIAEHISATIGQPFEPSDRGSVSGGCINQGFTLSDDLHSFFVKTNQASRLEMFTAEALGLQHLAATQTIRVPYPICWGCAKDTAYLVLEYLPLRGRADRQAAQTMGQRLAKLHRQRIAQKFGWERHNTIGSTPQINTWCDRWVDFFVEHRIEFQLRLAAHNGGKFELGAKLVDRIPTLLADHEPQPSLLHGDLWGGNAGVLRDGTPVIFDPATYYGDREADLAMTELFGGFSSDFYAGYQQEWPLSEGYDRRKILYNLYHILNHFNLFGSGYAGQADAMMRKLLH